MRLTTEAFPYLGEEYPHLIIIVRICHAIMHGYAIRMWVMLLYSRWSAITHNVLVHTGWYVYTMMCVLGLWGGGGGGGTTYMSTCMYIIYTIGMHMIALRS